MAANKLHLFVFSVLIIYHLTGCSSSLNEMNHQLNKRKSDSYLRNLMDSEFSQSGSRKMRFKREIKLLDSTFDIRIPEKSTSVWFLGGPGSGASDLDEEHIDKMATEEHVFSTSKTNDPDGELVKSSSDVLTVGHGHSASAPNSENLSPKAHTEHIIGSSSAHTEHIMGSSGAHTEHIMGSSGEHTEHIMGPSATHTEHIMGSSGAHTDHKFTLSSHTDESSTSNEHNRSQLDQVPSNCYETLCLPSYLTLQKPTNLVLADTSTLSLSCKSKLNASLLIWSYSNGSDEITLTSGTSDELYLVLAHLKSEDSGSYKCIAQGSESRHCCFQESRVKIYETPNYKTHLLIIGCVAGASVLTCVVLVLMRKRRVKKYAKYAKCEKKAKQRIMLT